MNIVSFPGLNLELTFSKIAFYILGIPIYKYAVCIVLGMIVGLIICKLNEKRFNIKYEEVLINFIFAVIIGIIGARLYFVLFKFNYYKDHIFEVVNIRDGGLAIYGGLISSSIYLILYYRKKEINVLDFFDYIVPAVAITQCIGRWGNFFNIEAYGSETSSFFRMGIKTVNEYLEVHPVFLYESICTFLIFIILEIMQKNRKYSGEIFVTYCLLYSGVRVFLESLRADSLMFLGFRVSQVLSLLIFLISFFIILKKCRIKSYEKSIK